MGRAFFVLACVATVAGAARGALYWDAWEGDNYPEMGLWHRTVTGGGAERTLVDGAMVLDGTASLDIADDYWKSDLPLPEPGQIFKAFWRLRVDEVQNVTDPIVCVSTPWPNGSVATHYSLDSVWFPHEGWAHVPIEPGVWHEYALISCDLMSTYGLYVDGQLAHEGQFLTYTGISGITWGDGVTGSASKSAWDYFRYGVVSGYGPCVTDISAEVGDDVSAAVPEPSTWVMVGPAGLVVSLARVRRKRR